MLDQEMLPILRSLCYLAWADSKVVPEERGYILDLADELEVRPEIRSQVEQWLETPPDLGDLTEELRSREDRKFLLMQLLLLSRVDGSVAPEEEKLIAKVTAELGLNEEEVAEVESAIDPARISMVMQEMASRLAAAQDQALGTMLEGPPA